MDSQDFLNLQEAYLEVYAENLNEEFKDLTPEKEKRVIQRRQELLKLAQYHHDKAIKNASEFTRRKEGRGIGAKIKHFLVGNVGPQRRTKEHVKQGKKYTQHIRNIGNALSNTQASRDANTHYKISQLRQRIIDLGSNPDHDDDGAQSNIRRFRRKPQNEAYELLISYLLDEGYANDVDSAENIAEHMSENWIQSILLYEGELADYFAKQIEDANNQAIERENRIRERLKK
jgi:hypothetical protein